MGDSIPVGHVLAVVNQKGGVGKTTTAINIAASMAKMGHRVLLVDIDPQANATSGLGVILSESDPTIYEILLDTLPASSAAVSTNIENLKLIPSTRDLAGAEVELYEAIDRESTLRCAIEPIRDCYDWILIDVPPSLGLLTVNALVAADSTLIPIQCEYYALEGVSQLLKTIELVRERLNPALQIGQVVLTMFDNRLRLNQQVVQEVQRVFGEKVVRRVVPRSVRLAEAPSFGMPVIVYDPKSKGAAAYREIANEVMKYAQKRAG